MQLDYSPPRYFRRRIIRKKYVRRDAPHQAPIIAELNTLQERSIAGSGLLAHIIVSKYCDHLPLYRQEQIALLRHELNIPRQSLARWVLSASEWWSLSIAASATASWPVGTCRGMNLHQVFGPRQWTD